MGRGGLAPLRHPPSRRDALQKALGEAGVGTLIHYPIPPHLQEAYRPAGWTRGAFPIAERLAERGFEPADGAAFADGASGGRDLCDCRIGRQMSEEKNTYGQVLCPSSLPLRKPAQKSLSEEAARDSVALERKPASSKVT